MGISYKLEHFEGPLDLLLHLIEKNKVSIYDIPIVTITEQYLDYVNHMDIQDLDLVSEFLVMAATLLDIKARMLLPREEKEEEEEEDPRAELVRRLLEYKMYKYMSYELKDMQVDAARSFYKLRTVPKEVEAYREPIDYEVLLGGMTLAKLQAIFESVLKRQEDKLDPVRSNFGRIEKDEINVDEKSVYVQDYIRCHSHFSFRDLLEKQRSKTEVIVTFLVVLEMMKTGQITAQQESADGEIMITVRRNP